MHLETEQEELLARLVEAARAVPRQEREWTLMSLGNGGDLLHGPGIGKEEVAAGDVHMLERQRLIYAVRYSKKQGNPTYVLTPEGLAYYAQLREDEPAARQESEMRRFLDSETFSANYPRAYAKWAEADLLLWRADTESELTTVGHKAREALQEFASEAVDQYEPPEVETDKARVNKRLGAVIATVAPTPGEARTAVLRALGDYSEATLAIVQRQEHGGQKEGEELTWQDARRVVFHAGSVMYEFAEAFREAASPR